MRLLFRGATVIVALAVITTMGLMTIRPSLSEAEQTTRAAPYGFDVLDLNSEPPGARSEREVAPALEHFRGWISAVGAGVALTDLRDMGRPTDACLIDPRDDSVTLRSVPGSGAPDYPVVELLPEGLPYDHTMAPMGCVPADYDEDGDTDLLVYYWGRSPVLFMNTEGPGATPDAANFTPHELVEPVQVWNSTAANVGDLDGDGHLDILIGNYFPDGARVLDPEADDDTRMEMQQSMGLARNAGTNKVYLTEPTGEADEVPVLVDASDALPEKASTAWTLAIGFQDLTDDALPEIYLGNDFGNDSFLVNHSSPGQLRLKLLKGERDITVPKSKVVGNGSFKGMGVAFTYTDGAELPTIVVSNITSPYALHESNFAFVPTGDGSELLDDTIPYHDESESLGLSRSGWSWDVKAGDFNNDGVDELFQATGFLSGDTDRWPELQEIAMGNDELLKYPWAWTNFQTGDDVSGSETNPFWVRGPEGRYADLAAPLGLAEPDVSRAYAFGDVNGDGLLDAVLANQWQDSRVLINEAPDAAPGICLRLLRPAAVGDAHRPALGARVVSAGDDVPVQTRQLYPANGHVGVSDDILYLAAPATGDLPVTVEWLTEGGIRSAELELSPGPSTVELNDDGTAVLR
ncbi:FG-GAP repeat domain-containing protein [Nocardiopsis ansamitocini]|uniref:RNA-binding protein n=1 Tax=Nocardiopsis ansamitocini TaxID=1670832 RepID=A0A9W6UJC8_9ACTN|nr:VCBS repeat-containing protein [Nocardiopsis ansamitocini]GLU48694.1 RNA-binding protein [Nocardiopsis ansamitocini]